MTELIVLLIVAAGTFQLSLWSRIRRSPREVLTSILCGRNWKSRWFVILAVIVVPVSALLTRLRSGPWTERDAILIVIGSAFIVCVFACWRIANMVIVVLCMIALRRRKETIADADTIDLLRNEVVENKWPYVLLHRKHVDLDRLLADVTDREHSNNKTDVAAFMTVSYGDAIETGTQRVFSEPTQKTPANHLLFWLISSKLIAHQLHSLSFLSS